MYQYDVKIRGRLFTIAQVGNVDAGDSPHDEHGHAGGLCVLRGTICIAVSCHDELIRWRLGTPDRFQTRAKRRAPVVDRTMTATVNGEIFKSESLERSAC